MPTFDAAEKKVLIKRHEDGEPLKALAKELGVSPNWLSQKFRSWGVVPRGRGAATAMRHKLGQANR
ncbi:hypothetical protein [Kitasatospora sp. MAA4]|uniref:hypothetical protein n=1 Tax=Kitasatospora sp. MAA4 TaxID=3035093 RepID=UPI002475FFA9|nr:hypothetical protein [Kitasatospora sp. MAA4]